MPREHGRVLVSIWRDRDFRQRSPEAQRLYVLLLSQQNINNAGILPLMVGKWAKGCDHTTEGDIQTALDELSSTRYVLFDDDTEEAFVRSYMRNDGILKQPNIFKNALRCAEAIESPVLRLAMAAELRRLHRSDATKVADILDPSGTDSEGTTKGFETLSEPFENPSVGIEPFRNPSLNPAGRGKGKGETLVGSGLSGEVAKTPPPPRCLLHLKNPTTDSCRGCKTARLAREEWDRDRLVDDAALARAARNAIELCELCDDFGWVITDPEIDAPAIKCQHATDERRAI